LPQIQGLTFITKPFLLIQGDIDGLGEHCFDAFILQYRFAVHVVNPQVQADVLIADPILSIHV